MNGIPVYPHPKNGERPYLAPSEPGFLDPIFEGFSPILSSPDPHFRPTICTSTTHPLLFYFYFIYSNIRITR